MLVTLQVAGAISIPELAITGYALSKVGQEHERRSQVPFHP